MLKNYAQPDRKRAIGQLLNSLVPYLALMAVMLYLVKHRYPYWITLVLTILAAGLLIRTFIIFHDCCHESFFSSASANVLFGYLIGTLAFTPFEQWRWTHFVHHETFGNLDRRGMGDIWMMTVEEYQAAPWWTRAAYWLYRNPFFLFGIGSALLFLLVYRLPIKGSPPRERFSVWLTNGTILAMVVGVSVVAGLRTYVLVQGPVLFIAWALGVWIFYIQHQFDGVYWVRNDQWDFFEAAFKGASYYRLPRVLQWFTGNIGLHHIHHSLSRIPNYHLQQCYNEIPELHAITPLTLRRSLRALHNNLYDEAQGKMVSFADLRRPADFPQP